jgi:hypothetical protein
MGDELTKRQNLLSAKNLGHWGLWKETRENTRFFQCAIWVCGKDRETMNRGGGPKILLAK